LLNFFKVIDPFRIFAIALIMVALSSIYIFVLGVPITQPEYLWMIMSEKLYLGKRIHVDLIDVSGPFAAGIYWIVYSVFGKSFVVFKILAGLIVLFQAYYINYLFYKQKTFEEYTLIPALIMVFLFHFSFDVLTFSPALMGSVFILLALGQILSQTILHKDNFESSLLIGVYAGIALCFHFPYIVFLPFLILCGILVTGYTFHQLLIAITGYFIPIIISALYYFWIDSLPVFITDYVFASRINEAYKHVYLFDLLILLILPITFSIFGFFFSLIWRAISVNQQKQKQIFILYFLFAALSLLLNSRRAPFQLLILMPFFTYFISEMLIHLRKGFMKRMFSTIFFLGIPIIGSFWLKEQNATQEINKYAIVYEPKHKITEGKSTLVLGNDIAYYKNASLATPYLNYKISKKILDDTEDLENIAEVYRNFYNDLPEIIIDEEGVFERLSKKITPLSDKYELIQKNVYVIKK
jgi:uncharacterized membrane protein YfbV (UPF0208 family)